jgi:hypothetical protein
MHMSDKKRQKKAGHDANKKRRAQRADNFNTRRQASVTPQRASAVSNLTDGTEAGPDTSRRRRDALRSATVDRTKGRRSRKSLGASSSAHAVPRDRMKTTTRA